MGRASFTGPMEAATLDNSTIIRFVARVLTHGPTDAHIKVPGRTIKWMALVFSAGQMAGSTSASTEMTISTGGVSLCGRMARGTMATGARATSKAKGSVLYQMGLRSPECGRKVVKSLIALVNRPK